MRITPTETAKPTTRARKTGSARGGGSTFKVSSVPLEAAASAAGSIGGAGPLMPVQAMLALQEAPDATDHASRGLVHGSELLQLLDQVRIGLLSGGIPRQTLKKLAADLKSRQHETADPRLAQVLGEIELRARVELAKYDD